MLCLTLSSVTGLSRQLSLTSLAFQNTDSHYIGECSAIDRRGQQGGKDNPLGSLARADMSGHRSCPQNTIPVVAAVPVNVLGASPSISLLNFPPELITRIFLYLSPLDIISCGRTCQILYGLCNDSALRYLVQMERCSVSEDMSPGMPYSERLRLLEEREDAWAMLKFRKSMQASVPFASTGTYDLDGGAFFLSTRLDCTSDQTTMGYSYLALPSLSNAQHYKLDWKEFNVEAEMLDFGPAVHEHDLIAVLTVYVVSCSHSSQV